MHKQNHTLVLSNSPGAAMPPSGCGRPVAEKPATTPTGPRPTTTSPASISAGRDIPDNRVFVTFGESAPSFSIRYPKGWVRRGSDGNVTFRDKDNKAHVLAKKGRFPAPLDVKAEMARLKAKGRATEVGSPQVVEINGEPAIKIVYQTETPPNPVSGKAVTLTVDRYYLHHAGNIAIVDLGTPLGVDKAEAYQQMIESFLWK